MIVAVSPATDDARALIRELDMDIASLYPGLPTPKTLGSGKIADELNHLLQELAWDAVTKHPLSGVKP